LNILYWHGLVSYSHYSKWVELGCAYDETPKCYEIFTVAMNEVGEIVQELVIINPTVQKQGRESKTRNLTFRQSTAASENQPSLDPDDLFQDFCTDNGTLNFSENLPNECNPSGDLITAYLNRADVQKAINVKPTNWSICSDTLEYYSNVGSLIPFYRNIFNLKPEIKVLIYSGDLDVMTVPFPVTQACLSELNDEQSNPRLLQWQPWFVNGATAGYVEQFANYTYATVKGAGHEAPGYQPLTSFNMFGRFLANQSLFPTDSSLSSNERSAQAMKMRERILQRPVTQGAVWRALRNQRPS